MRITGSRSASIVMVFALTAATLSGCSETPQETLWRDVANVSFMRDQLDYAFTNNDVPALRSTYLRMGRALETILEENDSGPQGLRRALEKIRDDAIGIGEGRITGSAVGQLRQEHEGYWEYLDRREVPPAFQD